MIWIRWRQPCRECCHRWLPGRWQCHCRGPGEGGWAYPARSEGESSPPASARVAVFSGYTATNCNCIQRFCRDRFHYSQYNYKFEIHPGGEGVGWAIDSLTGIKITYRCDKNQGYHYPEDAAWLSCRPMNMKTLKQQEKHGDKETANYYQSVILPMHAQANLLQHKGRPT